MVKQLKNRYTDFKRYERFVIGVDRSKMRLYDVENRVQENITNDIPVFDRTDTGSRTIDDPSLFQDLDDVGVSAKAREIFKDFK